MKPLDIALSVALHATIILSTLVVSPFEPRSNIDLGEVIRVSIKSMAEIEQSQPEPIPDIPVPTPMSEVLPEIAIDDPTTRNKAIVPQKPKPEKPKKKTPPKQTTTRKTQETDQDQPKDVGAGTAFAGASVDNASFDYPYWFTQAFNKIRRNFRNPAVYDGKLICVIYFQVIRSGRVVKLSIETSSGFPTFDEACVMAVEMSAPLPPLPKEFRDEIIGVYLPVTNY